MVCNVFLFSGEYIRVRLMTEDLEGEEAALKEDLYSADRRFTEYYNV